MPDSTPQKPPERIVASTETQSVNWYAEGDSMRVEIEGRVMTVRFVGRKGRRARIAITAPAGATFADGN